MANDKIEKESDVPLLGGIKGHVSKRLNDQNFIQRAYIVFIVPFELYRVVVSSLLILFVPQRCDGELCSMSENLVSDNDTYSIGLIVNWVTLGSFVVMYFFEVLREHYMIEYLQVNEHKLYTNNAVADALTRLDGNKKSFIQLLNKLYKRSGALAIIMYILNAALSAVILFHYNLGNQTVTIYATNVLFMVLKFIDVYNNITTEDNIFISAYMRKKEQFNDVDPDHIL